MIRRIIKINEDLCNGCGLCAEGCHENAIAMIDGKAKLIRDDYCDGLGDCLPVCPTSAISFEEREAAEYDEAAVKKNQESKKNQSQITSGCPGSRAQKMERNSADLQSNSQNTNTPAISQLAQWPVQIKLVPVNAPYFDDANLLIAADCSAFAFADFHNQFMKNHITLIGCPKLDEGNYADKLTDILSNNNIKSVTVVRMEVPCCGGIEYAVKEALQRSNQWIPWQVVTISTDGRILEK